MVTEAFHFDDLSRSRLARWIRDSGAPRKLAVALALAAIASGIATYIVLTGSSPFGPDPSAVLILLLVDLVLGLLLGAVVATRLVQLWLERRRGAVGSRLHTRVVLLFSFMAVAPAIVVATFSVLFYDLGVQAWFSDRVRTAVLESLAVAKAYTEEHRQLIRADALAMAADLNREAPILYGSPARFRQVVAAQAELRDLSEAIVFERGGRVLARTSLAFTMSFELAPEWALDQASSGDVVIINDSDYDRVRALIRLDSFPGGYLYVGRYVDPRVLGHVARSERAVDEYRKLETERSGVRLTFVLIFAMVAFLMLLAAVWFALAFASRLVGPVSQLVGAAEQVRAGDLTVRVPEGASDDEISTLSRAFNRMTDQLSAQRTELVETNHQLDTRRRFTEAVLSGVSAGVIGLNRDGIVNLPNRPASDLLGIAPEDLAGAALVSLVPEVADLLSAARGRPGRQAEGEISIERGGETRNLHVRVVAEREGADLEGFVVTMDDITDLMSAQRTAAWADIARRIAHEIKNPLTPIQLSAERLRRKYGDEVSSDPDVFVRCTDTIIRQVGDIRRMVDEFSSFARMPTPVFATENLQDIIQHALFLEQVANPEIDFGGDVPDTPISVSCDRRQIAQALANLLKNASQALMEVGPRDPAAQRRIVVRVGFEHDTVFVDVVDNGPGLPPDLRSRLFEPYVTTRKKGTGLGLAIVKKIMEDHGGSLVLEDVPEGGVRARLTLPHRPATARDDESPTGRAVHGV
jgi:two-component system nitrogen regulation sensor histidine kinase NtrY